MGLVVGVNVLAQNVIEGPHNNESVVAMKDLDQYAKDSVINLCQDLVAKKCYAVLVVPKVLGDVDDPFSDGRKRAAGSKIAWILEQNIPDFLKFLQDSPKHLVDVKSGEQYELVFLMREHPTSSDYRISMRIYDGRLIVRIRSKDGNELFVDTSPAFRKWMEEQFVTFIPAPVTNSTE